MPTRARPEVAIVHDYLTQRGGAERVVLSLCRAFPDAPVYTSMYRPETTFPEFEGIDIRTTWLDRVPGVGRRHRLAFPILARAFSDLRVGARVTIASSSGWAHAAQVDGAKIVYCHTPARWLYYPTGYLRRSQGARRAVLALARAGLIDWDRRAAATADLYVCNSELVANRVRTTYAIEPVVVPPPPWLRSEGQESAVGGLEPGYLLAVSRLLPYKRVDAVIAAAQAAGRRLVVVGIGPDGRRLRALAGPSVAFLGTVPDEQLRWLYRNAAALVCAGYEDFGLAPLEAFQFGTPVLALRAGGFLETVLDGVNGLFFDDSAPASIAGVIETAAARAWDRVAIRASADAFSEARFIARMRTLATDMARVSA